MKLLALLASVPFESDKVLTGIRSIRQVTIAGKTAYKGKLFGRGVLLMNTGIGKVNAAHSATAVIEHFPIRYVVNFGIGGAYPGAGLGIGDVAVASKEIYGDEGVITSKGWSGVKEIGIPPVKIGGKKYFNEFPLDKKRTKNISRSLKIRSGNFVTVSSSTGTRKRALELESRFNAVCENMEGAAVAQVCALYNILMIEALGISNIAGVRDKRRWDIELASENCQQALLEMIKNLVGNKA
ncbi:MAG TPA: futalosine hydrolase [Nitrospirae bacterium]|nr:futalosine hydrolase [Nitrospirota bacterium]